MFYIFDPNPERPFWGGNGGGGGESFHPYSVSKLPLIGFLAGIVLAYFFGWWAVLLLSVVAILLKICLLVIVFLIKETIKQGGI